MYSTSVDDIDIIYKTKRYLCCSKHLAPFVLSFWQIVPLRGMNNKAQVGSEIAIVFKNRENHRSWGLPKWVIEIHQNNLVTVVFLSSFDYVRMVYWLIQRRMVYTAPLGRIIQRHGVVHHLCADDIQLSMAFKLSDVTSKDDTISRIEACVADKRMNGNFLKLNDDKTEFLTIITREELRKNVRYIDQVRWSVIRFYMQFRCKHY